METRTEYEKSILKEVRKMPVEVAFAGCDDHSLVKGGCIFFESASHEAWGQRVRSLRHLEG